MQTKEKAAMSITSWWNPSAYITNHSLYSAVQKCATLIIIHFLLLWFIYSYLFSPCANLWMHDAVSCPFTLNSSDFNEIYLRTTAAAARFSEHSHWNHNNNEWDKQILFSFNKKNAKKKLTTIVLIDWSANEDQFVLNSQDFHFGFRNFSCSPVLHPPSITIQSVIKTIVR